MENKSISKIKTSSNQWDVKSQKTITKYMHNEIKYLLTGNEFDSESTDLNDWINTISELALKKIKMMKISKYVTCLYIIDVYVA